MADDEGLENGDYVMLTNQDGVESGPVQVKATERIRHDCVYLVHGFGRRNPRLTQAFGLGASDSDLFTKFKVDPLMGGTGMNLNFVSLRKVRKPRHEV
jgi:thiosulfate reductase/polysulfide reductase chain A